MPIVPASTLFDLSAGATVGKLSAWCAMRGGIGTAWVKVGRVMVGALVAVNAMGDVIDPSTGTVVAGTRTADGRRGPSAVDAILLGDAPPAVQAGMAPTTGVVAMDAVLTKAQARTLAQMRMTASGGPSRPRPRCGTATPCSRWARAGAGWPAT